MCVIVGFAPLCLGLLIEGELAPITYYKNGTKKCVDRLHCHCLPMFA